jgi:4-hydroxybenzoate polyprenyltransferase
MNCLSAVKGYSTDFLRFFLHGNFIPAVAAVSLSLVTQVQLGFAPEFYPFHLLIFAAGVAEYNLHRLLKFYAVEKSSRPEKYHWLSENLLSGWFITTISLIILLISFLFVGAAVRGVFLVSGFITLFYSLPVKGWPANFSLRRLPFFKTFILAFVWSSITVLIPAVHITFEPGYEIVQIFTGRFIFIFSLALLFDIRDTEADQSAGIKTIPVVFGETLTRRLAVILLFLFPLCSLVLSDISGKYYLSASAIILSLFLTMLVNCRSCRKSNLYYPVFLDGSMIFYSFTVIAGWMAFH